MSETGRLVSVAEPATVAELAEAAHADLAAHGVLNLAKLYEPAFDPGPEVHAAVVKLVQHVAEMLAMGARQ